MNRKDLRKLLGEAERQGFTVKTRKTGHHMVYGPDGSFVTTFAGTTSDWRSDKNGMSALKRAGFIEKGKS
jgi:hypothetical protein